MQGLTHDFQLAIRLLAKDRRFTLAAVIALGLGIGVTTSVFALVNAAMIRDVPFDEPDRLVGVRTRDARGEERGVSYADFRDWRDSATAFDGLSAEAGGDMNVSEEVRPPERFRGAYVSGNTFSLLRTAAIIGRDFVAEDDRPGAPAVVLLGYRVWRDRFGADPAVIGRSVRVNDVPATVIGVMPSGFRYPFSAEVWQPLSLLPGAENPPRDARTLGVLGRLRHDVDLSQASAELTTIAARLARDYAATNTGITAHVRRLKDQRPPMPTAMLWALGSAVGFVLLIAYANLANLLLARAVHRTRDVAIRISLGATRWRIIRQLLIECLLLALVGGMLGFILSIYGVNEMAQAFDAIEPGVARGTTRPYWVDLSPNGLLYVFVVVLCCVSALSFGLLPAWHIAKTDAYDTLKDSGRSAGGVRPRRWTSLILTAEIALTLMLLVSAGLLWRSFITQYRADAVIDTTDLVSMRLALPPQYYRTPEDRRRFLAQLDERLASVTAFRSVTMASHAPLEPFGATREMLVEGGARAPDEKAPVVSFVLAGSRYFAAVKLPLVRGRDFTDADARPGSEGVVVDQQIAARFFPNEDPIGRRVRFRAAPPSERATPASLAEPGPWFTIVGVAQTVPQYGPAQLIRPVAYVPLRSEPAPDGRAIVLVRGPLTATAAALREEVRAIDARLPLFAIETMDMALARSRFPVRVVGTWFATLALVALLLAAVGLYALTAHGVAQRVHEIGVRLALGAEAREVVWLFVRRMIVQLVGGVSLGLAGALSVGQLMQAFLRGTSPRDPLTVAIVTALLVVVAVLATLLPARRAARVDPVVALRGE